VRLAIMQPYFLPYAGYFRLFAATDLFVAYDCVQFPRRGWVHRNRFRHVNGSLEWLTLPLTKAPQDVRIDGLRFSDGRYSEWRGALHNFPCFGNKSPLSQSVGKLEGTPLDYIVSLLKQCCGMLDFPFNMKHSAALNLPDSLRGQDRVLEICRHFGATEYINSPGGRELYDTAAFAASGIKLRFLTPYEGDMASIGERLAGMDIASVKQEIERQMECVE
jgi:hypothetical protein